MPPMPVSLRLMRSVWNRCSSGIAGVHPQELGREQRRLLAAGARPDLHDDVAVVVGIARDERDLEVLDELRLPGLQLRDLVAGHRLHLLVRLGVQHVEGAGELLADVAQLPVRGDDGLQAGRAPGPACAAGWDPRAPRACPAGGRPRRTGARGPRAWCRGWCQPSVVRVRRQPAMGGSMAAGTVASPSAAVAEIPASACSCAARTPAAVSPGLGIGLAGQVQAALGDGVAVGLDRLLERHDRDLDHVVGRLLGRDLLDQDPGPHDHLDDRVRAVARAEAEELVADRGDDRDQQDPAGDHDQRRLPADQAEGQDRQHDHHHQELRAAALVRGGVLADVLRAERVAGLERVDRHVLGAVVLEDAAGCPASG